MNNFNERHKEFQRDFDRAKRWSGVLFIISAVITVSSLAFIIWAIVMTMRFFGIM